MGRVTIESNTNNQESFVEREIISAPHSSSLSSPLDTHRIVILEECQDELYDNVSKQEFDITSLNFQIEDLKEQVQNIRILAAEQKQPASVIQSITPKYDDKELRFLVQGTMEALDQVQKGQEFINERFRRDINSLRSEKQPISEIVRVHERLPKWVRYGFIFNFILALIGLLT